MLRLRLSTLAMVTGLLACAKVSGASDEGVSEPPPVWAEFDTMPRASSQAEGAGSIDPASFEGKIIGIAFGPSRGEDASDVSEEMAILNVNVLDSWSVDSETWAERLKGVCIDRVVHYNPESRVHALQLAHSLRGGLAVAEERSEANYDLIVQLCPVDLQ